MELLKELGINSTIIAAQVTGFILLLIVLGRYLFKPVMTLLAAREQDIRSTYDAAETARTQADEYRDDLERRLSAVEVEARGRLQAAVKEGQDAKDDILADARNRAEEILRRGQESLDREREKTLAELREEVVNLSLAATSKLLEESLDEARHRKLVNDFIDRIGITS
jgi:F-type H+-transporting ATPase subunit b